MYLEVQTPIVPAHAVAKLASRERDAWIAEEAARRAREAAEAAAERRARLEARRARLAWRSRWDLWANDVASTPHFEVAPTVVVWPSRESSAALRRAARGLVAGASAEARVDAVLEAISPSEEFARRRDAQGFAAARSIQRVTRGLVARTRMDRPSSPATLRRRLDARDRRQREALSRERRCAMRWRQRDVDLKCFGHLGDVLRDLERAAALLDNAPCFLGSHVVEAVVEESKDDDAWDWFAPVATCFEDVKPQKTRRVVQKGWTDARDALRVVLRSPFQTLRDELPLRVTCIVPTIICCVDATHGTLVAASSRSDEFDDVLVRAFDRAVKTWKQIARQFHGGARRPQSVITHLGLDDLPRADPTHWDLLIVTCSLKEATIVVSDVVPCRCDDPTLDVGLFDLAYLDTLRSRPPGDDYPDDDNAVRRRLDSGRIFEWRGPLVS